MMRLVRWGEHLALVDIVDPQGLQNLRLGKMPNTHLGHHGNGHRLHDLFDLRRVGHACDAPLGADIRRDAFQGHHGHRSCVFSDLGLVCSGDVHDHATLQHLGQAGL